MTRMSRKKIAENGNFLSNIDGPELKPLQCGGRGSEISRKGLMTKFYTILFLLSIQPENVKPRVPRITVEGRERTVDGSTSSVAFFKLVLPEDIENIIHIKCIFCISI